MQKGARKIDWIAIFAKKDKSEAYPRLFLGLNGALKMLIFMRFGYDGLKK
jgi:hypothetical protein